MAAGAHPLLGLRPRLHAAARDADVLPRRPAVRRTTRSSTRCATRRRATLLVARFDLETTSRSGRSATAGTSSSAAADRHDADGRAVTLPRTPSQTVGPYYAIGLCRRAENELAAGRAVELDAAGCSTATATPIPDGVIELWDAAGAPRGAAAARDAGRRASRSSSRSRAAPGEAPHLEVLRLRARPAPAPADADLLPGRATRTRPTRCSRRSTRPTARRWSRRRTATACASTSTCRATRADGLLRQ